VKKPKAAHAPTVRGSATRWSPQKRRHENQTTGHAILRIAWERPPAKAGAGFEESGAATRDRRGDRTARCVIRQNQAHRNNEAWHRAVAETHSARCKRTRKVSVFGTLSAVREKTGATSLQRNSTRCERKRHGQDTFNLQSESARDSCPRASQASGRDRSTSRQSSGCGTWRPKPFCAP
jgi:hypothetical protein